MPAPLPDGGDARLNELVEFVVLLAAGQLDARLEPSPAADEVDAITVGLNMLTEELQALTLGLEERVHERTGQLAVARDEHLALYDPLTGLANRALLAERIGQAMKRADRGASPPAVLVLDLDGFKAVNDSFGPHRRRPAPRRARRTPGRRGPRGRHGWRGRVATSSPS